MYTRKQVRKKLTELLVSSTGVGKKDGSGCELLAFKAMAAVEEIFEGIFKPLTVEDYEVVSTDPDCKPCIDYIINQGYGGHTNKAIGAVLQKLNNQNNAYLKCLGMEKPEEGGRRSGQKTNVLLT